MIADLIQTGYMFGALFALALLPMAYPRTRRVMFAAIKFSKRHCPKWLLPILTVCLFIPGPIDEIAVILIATVPILKSRHNRRSFARYVRYAWSI